MGCCGLRTLKVKVTFVCDVERLGASQATDENLAQEVADAVVAAMWRERDDGYHHDSAALSILPDYAVGTVEDKSV